MPLCNASVDILFITDAAAKILKNATYFGLYKTPLGAIILWFTFLESCCQADVKTQLTCNAVTYRFWDIRSQMAKIGVREAKKWSTWSPFLTLHLETPKKIATKRGEARSGTQGHIVQTFMPIGRTVAEIITHNKKYRHTRWYIQQNSY